MALGIFGKIRRHAAIAAGDFATMFREVEIPPLPAAVSHLIAEISPPDPDLDRVVQLISSSTAITAKVIKAVNSSLYALRRPVTSYPSRRHAPGTQTDPLDCTGLRRDGLASQTLRRPVRSRGVLE